MPFMPSRRLLLLVCVTASCRSAEDVTYLRGILTMNPGSLTLAAGETRPIVASPPPGVPVSARTTWEGLDPAVARLDSVAADTRTAYVRGVAPGATRLLAATNGQTAEVPVTVR